jgi:hypothetical protein
MRALIAPALVTLLVAGCGPADVSTLAPRSALTSAAPFRSQGVKASVPISGSCSLTFAPPPIPIPPVFEQVDTGTCSFTHLGESTMYGVQEINLVAGTQAGTRTFTAANGDLLRGTHAGTSRPAGPGLVSFSARFTITGGTGRFANATGYLDAQGVANLIARTTQSSFEGEIVYDASDRSAR